MISGVLESDLSDLKRLGISKVENSVQGNFVCPSRLSKDIIKLKNS